MNPELLLIMLAYSTPGLVLGAAVGGFGWTQHRARGAVIGAAAGLALAMLFWFVYLNTDLSVHFDPDELIRVGLRRGWPGIPFGAAFGAALLREHRGFGTLCGAMLGFPAGLLAWWMLFG